MDAEEVIRRIGEERFIELFGPKTIFVFESDLAGNHTEGDALIAVERWGARSGVPAGFCGNSFAIPTIHGHRKPLPLEALRGMINLFLAAADTWPQFTFRVGRIGCILAGYADAEMAPMFTLAPDNCEFPREWSRWGLKTWTSEP